MPRFFFNIRDGKNIRDTTGADFPNWHEARRFAVRYAGRILDEEADVFALGEDWCMEVCDDTGLILFRLDFSVCLASAVSEAAPR